MKSVDYVAALSAEFHEHLAAYRALLADLAVASMEKQIVGQRLEAIRRSLARRGYPPPQEPPR